MTLWYVLCEAMSTTHQQSPTKLHSLAFRTPVLLTYVIIISMTCNADETKNSRKSSFTLLSHKLSKLLGHKFRPFRLNDRNGILLEHPQRLLLPLRILLRLRTPRFKPIVSIVPASRHSLIAIRIASRSIVPAPIPTSSIVVIWVAPRSIMAVVRVVIIFSTGARSCCSPSRRRVVVIVVVSARTRARRNAWLLLTFRSWLGRRLRARLPTAWPWWRTFIVGNWTRLSPAVSPRWGAFVVGFRVGRWIAIRPPATRKCVYLSISTRQRSLANGAI